MICRDGFGVFGCPGIDCFGLLDWMPREYRIFGIRGRKIIAWVMETPTLQLFPVKDTQLRPDRNCVSLTGNN